MRIKICGITNIEDAFATYGEGVDALGFIFYEKSQRYIEPGEASNIIRKLPPFITAVGVFVNTSADEINRIAEAAGINMIQLHGEETPDIIPRLTRPVIKSFRVRNEFRFEEIEQYKNCYYLLDTYSELGYGGTGEKFDWNLIPANLKHKIILAGGIGKDDLEKIQRNINPAAIDVSSSIELKPGKKDINKLKELMDELRKINPRQMHTLRPGL
ncbi:phosphoribosylanthranilate isomerase [Melioribacter sp. Ez-97]|uniref:phosphoribosylanthranilate isomerase n=1 Tax=Melioribacter sp. Ez-97 TaxID=3423434 RepID=UPI003ED882D4